MIHDKAVKVGRNAARLIGDAKLLFENERFASAFALSVLGLEELGKAALLYWDLDRNDPRKKKHRTAHVRKQSAVSAMLIADLIVEQFGDRVRPGEEHNLKPEELAQAVFDSTAGRFEMLVSMGAVDKTKQAALYFDENFAELGLTADGFGESDVQDLLDKATCVAGVLDSNRKLRVAKNVFEHSCGNAK